MESTGFDRAKCLAKLERKAELASQAAKAISTTLNSSPVILASLARESELAARATSQASSFHEDIGVDGLVWPLSDVLSTIQNEIARLPTPAGDDQLVIVWNEAEFKRALGTLKAVRTSLDALLKQHSLINKPVAAITVRKMPSATLPLYELAGPLGLTESRPVTSASSQVLSYMTRRNRQLAQLLHLAIDKGNGPAVLELLQQGADPLMLRPGSLVSPLHRALDCKNEYIATLLAAGGADINEADDDNNGLTPLMKGVKHCLADKLVAVLCDLGADVCRVDAAGDSALHYAADSDRSDDTVGILVLGGADANLRNHQGYTPLSKAISSGCHQAARQLLEYGADLEVRLPDGRSALHHSVLRKDQVLCDLLIEFGACLDEDFGDHTPLTLSIATGCTGIARSLIKAGADVDQRATSGNFPLIAAISLGDSSLTGQLLDHEASLEMTNWDGYCAIHMAARRSSVDILRQVVAYGSAIDPVTNDAETPLCIAIKFRNQGCVDFLISIGADFNHRINKSSTVLSLALQAGDSTILQALLGPGADPTALLTHDDGTETTPLHTAAAEEEEHGPADTLRLMLDACPDLEVRIWPGYTPLFSAARAGRLTALKLLVSRGADLQARSLLGESLLSVATEHTPVLKHLLGTGMLRVDHRDHYGATALHHAGGNGRLEAVRVLMREGARSLHANAVYDCLEDFRAGGGYRQGTPAGVARQRGFVKVADAIDRWKYK